MGGISGPHWEAYEAAMRRHFSALDLEHWWPAETAFEMIVGSLLVQNTNWRNVAKAMASLRGAGRLSLEGVRGSSAEELGLLIRSAGTWRQKAKRLLGFVDWLDAKHEGSLEALFAQPTGVAREQLLEVAGIGEETADAILTFAGGHGSFVVDAYTRRIFARHGLEPDEARRRITAPEACRDWHALLVETGKQFCRKQTPQCGGCPLETLLPAAEAV